MIRGRFDEGWNLSEKLEIQDPDNVRHQFNRAWFLLNQGKFQEGSRLLEGGRFIQVYGNPQLPTKKPIWNNEPLQGKTVVLGLEGGLGDQIIHARFVKSFADRGATAVLLCEEPLVSIMKRVPGASKVITLDQLQFTSHDFWIPGFSSGWVLGYDYSTLPNNVYLFSNQDYVAKWKTIIKSDKFKVGIRWSGNPKFEHQQFRIFPPEKLINLAKYSDIQFYSLQRDNDLIELPDTIIDLNDKLESWEDTAAAIENLDLVITSCTSIAHLSAAMGKPTWILIPVLPYHVWAYGDSTSPWYQPQTRLFRQTEFGNWNHPFDQIEISLIQKFNLKKDT